MRKSITYSTVVLHIILYILTVVTLASGMVKFCLSDSGKYYEGIINDEFDNTILSATKGAFQTNQSVVALPSQELYESLNRNALLEDAHKYTRSVIHSLFTGEEVVQYRSEHKELAETVNRQFDAFEQESGMKTSEEDRTAILNLFIDNVNAQANYLPEALTGAVSRIGTVVSRVVSDVSDVFWPMLLLTVCVSVIIFVLNKDNLSRAAYKSATALWLASATIFIPTMIFCSYDVTKRLKLVSSGMASFVQGFIGTVESSMRLWSVLFFCVFTVGLAGCIVWYSLVKAKRHRPHI